MTTPTPQQVTMTLAAVASTCAAPRPSGEDLFAHATRILAGIRSHLSDPGLATGGTWTPLWLALSPGNTNLCYIAQNLASGSNEFAVVIRGTNASLTDILENLDVGTVVPFTAGEPPDPIAVSKGAMAAFTQIVNAPSIVPTGEEYSGTTLVPALATLLESAPGTPQPTVYVTGHSLGGCLASMVAVYLQAQKWINAPAFAVYTFAAPTAGLKSFADYFTSIQWAAANRTVNAYDVVPRAWDDLQEVKKWYPAPGPKANLRVKEIIGVIAGMTKGNVYHQPGHADLLNFGPRKRYKVYDPDLVNKTEEDFIGQAAFQHANNTYLRLLDAPAIPAGPVVTAVAPSAGESRSSVIISGSGFTPDSVVDFGPIPGMDISIESATEITAVVPDGAGIVDVFVTTVLGTSAAGQTAQFAYGGPEPVVVTSIDPRTGNHRDTTVAITGSGFTPDCKVHFGGEQSASVTFTSGNQISATPPDHKAATVDVTVTVGVATSPTSPADEFTYAGRPAEAPS